MKTCTYQCYDCEYKWEKQRVLQNSDGTYRVEEGPGPTICPQCKHEYVHWLNYEAFAVWYRKHIGDGGCGGNRKGRA